MIEPTKKSKAAALAGLNSNPQQGEPSNQISAVEHIEHLNQSRTYKPI